jgi:NRPS condensation-like uncharacterized protein
MPAQLNIFQKSMLQWNDLHPYNAVHVVRIPGSLDVVRLKGVIAMTLEREGLTGLTLNRRRGTYHYHGGPSSAEISVTTADAVLNTCFAKEIEHQLNSPFTQAERFSPFRFFVVPEVDSFSLGLVYFHAIADAECIVILLKEMVEAYRSRDSPGRASPVDRHPPRRDHLLDLPPGVLARKLTTLPSQIRAMRSACRPRYRDAGDSINKCAFFSLNPPTLNGMIQAAKTLGVTFNDLLLSLLMKAVSLLTPDRTRARRRRGISLGCIVNIRKDLGMTGGQTFGLFLGSFVVHHEVPGGTKLADLARDIGRQTLRIKRSRLYLGAPLELGFGRLMTSLFSEQRRRKLYQKHYPLWGGLTNMNLNALWPQTDDARPVDYFRAVSTGPVTPLVVSLTTVGRVANIGLTYRSTAFEAPDIERIKGCFMEALDSFAASQ